MFYVTAIGKFYSNTSYYAAREVAVKQQAPDMAFHQIQYMDEEIVVEKPVNPLHTIVTWYTVDGEFVSPISVFNTENGAYKVLDREYTWHKYQTVKYGGKVGTISSISPFGITLVVDNQEIYVSMEDYSVLSEPNQPEMVESLYARLLD